MLSAVLAQPEFSEFPASANSKRNMREVKFTLTVPDSVLTARTYHYRTSTSDVGLSDFNANVKPFRVRVDHGVGFRTQFAYSAESMLYKELASYVELEDDWDGNGAKAPSQTAVDDALTFLDAKPADLPLPYPEEGTEGDVGIYWEDIPSQVFAEVNFEGDGTYAYFAVRGTPDNVSEKCGKDSVDINEPWPEELQNILRRIVIA